ncbi:MAG: DUF1064 domain-containing protein [Candidatus Omnitrophica bacterium]|nr:DUF1064 domain-containing protein [Candidatus Omnitrophota bacterium]
MYYRKYNAKPVFVDGIRFDSKKEGSRYKKLKELKESGEVISFELQKPYPLNDYAKTKREQIKYCCDFFIKWKDGTETIEDTKGFKTQVYKIKKKLFETKYRIKIVES